MASSRCFDSHFQRCHIPGFRAVAAPLGGNLAASKQSEEFPKYSQTELEARRACFNSGFAIWRRTGQPWKAAVIASGKPLRPSTTAKTMSWPLLALPRRHVQKKTLVARDQDRPDAKRHRLRWRSHQRRIDPSRFSSSTNLDQDQHDPPLRLGAARPTAHRQGSARPVWTPPSTQEESWSGMARDRVRSCIRPLVRRKNAAGPYGIRGSGPHHWSALEALSVRLVFLTLLTAIAPYCCPPPLSHLGVRSHGPAMQRTRRAHDKPHRASSPPRRSARSCWRARR